MLKPFTHPTDNKDAFNIAALSAMKPDPDLAFRGLGIKDTTYATHGYHRYPAKFIPQLAYNLIRQYTEKGDVVADVFAGCGTTLVEAKIHGRISVGVDINPVATLITKAKIKPILPSTLEREFDALRDRIDNKKFMNGFDLNERIDFWFREEEKNKIAFLLENIKGIENRNAQRFFYCAFSNILKNCSIWMQKSIKPTRDFDKTPQDPYYEFNKQVKRMIRGNAEYYKILKNSNHSLVSSKIFCRDAINTKIQEGWVDCIVTSPPYMTSYEYADIHQLTAFWLKETTSLKDFRKKFIGSSHKKEKDLILTSDLACDIYQDLKVQDENKAKSIATYFSDMQKTFNEMHRILKRRGKACIVIGNTELKGVDILNAQVFIQQLRKSNFEIIAVSKREIPSKNLPSTRNKETGRFAKANEKNIVTVYPTEHIIVAEKR